MAYVGQNKFRGFDRVLGELQRQLNNIREGSAMGLVEAAEFIHVDTEKTPPLTPVDTGNLRSSWTTRFFRRFKKSVVIFGYSANYAIFVHEMVGGESGINWSRPNSGAKWFEHAIKRNVNRVLHIIAGNSKIGR